MKKTIKFIALALATSLAFTSCGKQTETTDVGTNINENYLSKVDVTYAKDFAKSLSEFKSNEKLGYRPAGSDAEIAAGNKIFDEMKKIGLEEVTRDEFTVDKWEFKNADMTFTDKDGKEYNAVLGGYQTTFITDGPQEFTVVYAGTGSKTDLEGIDVTDKLVLVDINQRENWWISYPAIQLSMKGAKGVIAVQDGGYAEIDPSALNAQDICGPYDAPAFSMSQTDANVLKELITANGNNEATVKFDAYSEVTLDQPTYNYYGKIIGKDPDSYIILSAHYDAYFDGFQDDSAAIGLMLGVAKGLVDSGYKPEKTIIFNALAAEEWGATNTRYDWSTGAYNQVFKIHPEWYKKAVVDMNFELPAYEHKSADEIRATFELKNYLEKFAETVPAVEGVYADGLNIVAPLRTWSDDFSFSIAGIPALRNDFQDSEFMNTHYHSQFDNEDTFNEKALQYHLNLYGLLTMYYDRTAVVPLDFKVRLQELKKSIDAETFKNLNIDSTEFIREIDKAIETTNLVNEKVNKINSDYLLAIESGDIDTANKLYKESRALNEGLIETYKFAQDNLLKLTWEDEPIFPHVHSQNNIQNLTLAIDALKSGDVKTPVDEYLWKVDNNWYAYDFEKDVYDYFTEYVLHQPAERLFWGAGRIVGHQDLYNTINSLLGKYDTENADVKTEIDDLNNALINQGELLKTSVNSEISSVKTMNEMLSKLQ